MQASPQSQAALDKLLCGGALSSGDLTIGPLAEPTTILLSVVADRYEDLRGRSGTDQAHALRRLYMAAARTAEEGQPRPSGIAENEGRPVTGGVAKGSPPGWRLLRLRCQSIRGIAPHGEVFTFSFEGKSTLIFGPNGSGKSSLLSAVGWVLTGQTATDADEGLDQAPLYSIPKSSGKSSKIKDWPVIHTLPPDDPRRVTPACWARIELRSTDGRQLHLRRSTPGALESSSDGATWGPCPALDAHGIQPLDVQLSLLAPAIFARRSIESASNTRHLLSLMLGYDDLENIGELAGLLGRNRTILANAEKERIDAQWAELRQKLGPLSAKVREELPARADVAGLSALSHPSVKAIDDAEQAITRVIETAERDLAHLLGLATADTPTHGGLADALTSAVMLLEKGVWHTFPSLSDLRLQVALSGSEDEPPSVRLAALFEATSAFVASAKRRIANRLQWWRKETERGSKSSLLIQAAQYPLADPPVCPVCDQPITDLPVHGELTALQALDPDLLRQVKEFFRDLEEELDAILPLALRDIARNDPADRLREDWENLRDTIGPELTSVIGAVDASVRSIAAGLAPVVCEDEEVVPADADDPFKAHAAGFTATLLLARRALAILGWAELHLARAEEALRVAVTALPAGEPPSLCATLSRGKQAAADIIPLTPVRDELRSANRLRNTIAAAEEQLAHLDAMKSSIEDIKGLLKYAARQVGDIFGAIREKTLAHCQLLYPESSSGLSPARLVMGTGRDRTVEAYLSGGDFEVPGQHYANAGLQRAITLSFFFALLDQHPGGLGFVVMDDPILSLDDDHREAWSAHILKPKLETTQIVLATHQRQYLNHCKHDFQNGQLIELNPRAQARCISWRPGDRLDRAEEEAGRAWTNAPTELRKYREEVLITLDAYSPSPFFMRSNLAQSLENYAAVAAPHPLSGSGQQKIVAKFKDQRVARVLDPGSHALTEGDLTEPMVRECLRELRECDAAFKNELCRLDRLRAHQRRATAVMPPATATVGLIPILQFKGVCPEATWDEAMEIPVLGRAAARTNGCIVEMVEEVWLTRLAPGGAVLVAGETLEPVARRGQWALLASDEVPVADGELAAVMDTKGNRLLREIWSDGDRFILQSINPVKAIPSLSVDKAEVALRKVIGVLYEPSRTAKAGNGTAIAEWQPRSDFDPEMVKKLYAITIQGTSLDPIARHGQKVLVADKHTVRDAKVLKGSLAVLETTEEGHVIKRVFFAGRQWVLDSPNPVDPHDPIVITERKIRGVWPVRGVLFEMGED